MKVQTKTEKPPRQEYFRVPTRGKSYIIVSRGEALRAFMAAIFDTARQCESFTTDDVFPNVRTPLCSHEELRKATASSKLIAVALRRCAKLGGIVGTGQFITSDNTAHGRPKQIWESNSVKSSNRKEGNNCDRLYRE